jgi:hypothetical protein
MPVVQTLPPLKSPPTNAFGLVQYLQQRLPGYDTSEYLRELNSAYIHVWEEVTKLKNNYFTNIKRVTVAVAQYSYDVMFNEDGGLGPNNSTGFGQGGFGQGGFGGSSSVPGAVSSRLYQITKIRVQSPAGGLFQSTMALQPNHPDFISVNANASSTPTQTGPYYWYLSGRNQLNFGLPLAVGTVLEITYTFWPIALVLLANGTVSSSGNIVTGASTNFTNLMQPDYQNFAPVAGAQEEIQAELICNGSLPLGGQIYRVASIVSDTSLTTLTPVAPVLAAASPYILATLPEIPREHIRVVAALAMGKMYSVAGDDARVSEWTAIGANNLQMMKDALIERQGQNPPQKIRFPHGIGKRNRAFLR